MLMSLGEFVFERATLAPNEVNKSLTANLPKQNRYGGRPAVQFAGIAGETVSMPGILYPGSKITGTAKDLQELKDMMVTGDDYVLVGGDGYVSGLFKISSITEKLTLLDGDGRAQKIEFDVALERTDDDRVERIEA